MKYVSLTGFLRRKWRMKSMNSVVVNFFFFKKKRNRRVTKFGRSRRRARAERALRLRREHSNSRNSFGSLYNYRKSQVVARTTRLWCVSISFYRSSFFVEFGSIPKTCIRKVVSEYFIFFSSHDTCFKTRILIGVGGTFKNVHTP